jgi:hypothetical protein
MEQKQLKVWGLPEVKSVLCSEKNLGEEKKEMGLGKDMG